MPKCSFKRGMALFIGCLLAGLLQTEAGAQSFPGIGSFDLSQVNVSPPKVGLFYGVGSIRADHNLSPGPAFTPLWSVGPDFNAFIHHRKTDLNDLYFSVESGIKRNGGEILNARVETNFGRVSKFQQDTDPGTVRRETNLLVFLEADEEGVITRDVKNKIWDVEICGRLPFTSFADILIGYKYDTVSSNITPYKAGYLVPDPPPHPSIFLPGLLGWAPYVLDADNPPLPNSEQLKMTETFRWQGPVVGMRFTDLLAGFGPDRSYLDVMWSPCILGRYEFSWDTGFTGVYGSGKASQVTKVNRKLNTFLEIRSGASFPLVGNLSCEVFLKYSCVRMILSDVEHQSVDLEWPSYSAYNAVYTQQAKQSINMFQELFGAGASLVASF